MIRLYRALIKLDPGFARVANEINKLIPKVIDDQHLAANALANGSGDEDEEEEEDIPELVGLETDDTAEHENDLDLLGSLEEMEKRLNTLHQVFLDFLSLLYRCIPLHLVVVADIQTLD